jgi:hypothetical protein
MVDQWGEITVEKRGAPLSSLVSGDDNGAGNGSACYRSLKVMCLNSNVF